MSHAVRAAVGMEARWGWWCQLVGTRRCCGWGWDARRAAETGPALSNGLWLVLVRWDPAPLRLVTDGTGLLGHTGDTGMGNRRA